MFKIVDNIQIAHSGMQQMPGVFVIPAWGHGGGDFLFISRKLILCFISFNDIKKAKTTKPGNKNK